MEQQELKLFDRRPVCTVTEIVEQLRSDVESRFRDLWVQGEISNLVRPGSGHLYFTLKDERCQLSAVCFRMQNRHLRFEPRDGMDVIARGSAGIYAPRGQLQLIVETLEPLGAGALQIAFEQLKSRLQQEGLFEQSRKRPLPLLPRRIGVVSSPTGAAVRDILRILGGRNQAVHVLICPTRVQGDAAAAEIEAGLRTLGRRSDLDAVILARGGGSLEDLWAFNEERVARAIFECPIPVISAIGHEIDFTIADFVADLRAPTPSAAAEMVTGRREELLERVIGLRQRAAAAARAQIRERRHRLQHLTASRGLIDIGSRLRLMAQRLDELQLRLSSRLPALVKRHGQRLDQARLLLAHRIEGRLQRHGRRFEQAAARLESISPMRVLERGFALVSTEEGRLVRSPADLDAGERFIVQVARGRFAGRREEGDDDEVQGL